MGSTRPVPSPKGGTASQASPVDFCNQHSLRARPRDRHHPRPTIRWDLHGSRRAGGDLRVGFGPIRHIERHCPRDQWSLGLRVIPAPVLSTRASRPESGAHRRYQPRFRGSGAAQQSRPALPVRGGGFLDAARSRESTQTRSARAPPVASSSRRRSEDRSRTPEVRHEASRRLDRRRRRAEHGRARDSKSRATTCGARGPTVRAARAARSPYQPTGGGQVGDPCRDPRPLSRARATVGTVEAHVARAPRAPGTEGRFSRGPAKGVGIGCTRGAFHRWTAMGRALDLRPLRGLTR